MCSPSWFLLLVMLNFLTRSKVEVYHTIKRESMFQREFWFWICSQSPQTTRKQNIWNKYISHALKCKYYIFILLSTSLVSPCSSWHTMGGPVHSDLGALLGSGWTGWTQRCLPSSSCPWLCDASPPDAKTHGEEHECKPSEVLHPQKCSQKKINQFAQKIAYLLFCHKTDEDFPHVSWKSALQHSLPSPGDTAEHRPLSNPKNKILITLIKE